MSKDTSILQHCTQDKLDQPQVAPERYAVDGMRLKPDKFEGYRDRRTYSGNPEQHHADFLNATLRS